MKISEAIKFLEGVKDILGDVDISIKGATRPNGGKTVIVEFPKITIQVEDENDEYSTIK